jgi:hypothetical protein
MNESISETVQWLMDRVLISELLHSFARSLDTRDVESYVGNFAENGILELPNPTSKTGEVLVIPCNQLEEFVRKGLLAHYSGTHHISSNQQITISGDTAASRSYLQAVHVRQEPGDHWDAGGWYDCKYVRTSAGWKFSHVKLSVIWFSGNPGTIRPGS